MELAEFVIGDTFWTHHGEYRCTDIGTRVVVAVKLGPQEIAGFETVNGEQVLRTEISNDPSWLSGPPYAVMEVVFDEDDLEVCFKTQADLRADAENN